HIYRQNGLACDGNDVKGTNAPEPVCRASAGGGSDSSHWSRPDHQGITQAVCYLPETERSAEAVGPEHPRIVVPPPAIGVAGGWLHAIARDEQIARYPHSCNRPWTVWS